MKIKAFFKHFYPLIVAFITAAIFFLGYNHYLIDKSFVNLKISIKKLKNIRGLSEIEEIKAILDDALIMSLASEELNAVALAETQFGNSIISGATEGEQLEIARNFLMSAAEKKEKARPVILAALDNLSANIFPFGRTENSRVITGQISKIKKGVSSYNGKELQLKYIEISKLYIKLKDWNNASFYLREAINVMPDNSAALVAQLYLGLVDMASKEYVQAKNIFSQIKKKLPDNLGRLASYQEGVCLYKIGRTTEALDKFSEEFDKDSGSELSQLGQFQAGYIYLYDLKNEFKAYQAFRKIVELAPSSELSEYIKETILPLIAKRYRGVGFEYLYEGYKYLKAGKFSEALEQFNLALEVYPLDALAYSGKSLAFYFLENSESALVEGRKAKEIAPSDAEVLANLGFVYYNLDMISEAITALEKAVNLQPQIDVFHYDLGTLYLLEKEYQKAVKQFRETIKINPQFTYAYNNLGYILWLEQKYAEAKSFLEKAISINKEYVDACYNLGVVLYSLGNYEEAGEKFLRVEQLRPSYRKVKWYLQEIKKYLGY
ncbi:MAG: tetratricopeptide repeat protein [Candidatus Omnitrophota bacterium]|jgi:tetratricopeptide (TPR) repeat protein